MKINSILWHYTAGQRLKCRLITSAMFPRFPANIYFDVHSPVIEDTNSSSPNMWPSYDLSMFYCFVLMEWTCSPG